MRDELGVLYEDADFATLFPPLGRPALPPWRLALITIFQFLEGLPDRQAADAVRARLDWKYALGLELTDSGFDFSVLTEFRSRLIEGNQEHLLLDKMLSQFKARDLLKLRGKQRTDSTHVIGAVRRLWRLDLIVETLRAALNQIAHLDSEWLQPRLTAEWVKRYARRVEMERLPTSEQARERYAVEVGQDGFDLLEMLDQDGTEGLRCLEAVGVLRLVWEQQFAVDADSKAVRWKAK
ncbi:transposase [Deinococcus saxicola]|uniref:transposase n=1 Tax=Deinococcus saxicola TaxID=249406 RepID=UPI0039EE5457